MKKNFIIFIICCLWGSISLYAQPTDQPYGEDPASWKYHGGDEFNEGKVDPLKWGVYVPTGETVVEKSSKYILGDAISGIGWDNRKALALEQADKSKAIYTWTGQLGSGHFKFITELGTWKSIIPTQSRNENVLSGYPHSVTDKWHGDYRFNVTVAGNYTVTLNMEDNTMTVVKDDTAMPIYLLGDAIPGADGWNNNVGIEMEQTATGVYTWTGVIDKSHYFRIISQLGTWHSILPSNYRDTETLQSGVAIEISNGLKEVYGFSVTEKGTYSLTLDLTNKTLMATQISKEAPVYILGDAVSSVGWDNEKALALGQEDKSKAIYTWTGQLNSGQFKFITELGTWKSIIPQFRNENVLSGYKHSVMDQWPDDYRFNVTITGNYTVTLNMEDNTMTVVKNGGAAMPIYLLGAAIPAADGWNNNAGIEMEQTVTGVYTWTGVINEGYFKFISQLGTWHSILPEWGNNKTLQSGVAADISNDFREDYKFAVTERGTYSLTLDLTNKTLVATQISKGGPVYILGDAMSFVGWDNKKALEMEQPDASKAIYTWTGTLYGNQQFKFITELGTWKSIIPTQSRNENILSSYPHSVTDIWHGDYRFNVTVSGEYTVTLNMEDNTMTVVKNGGAATMPIYLLGDAIPAADGWNNNAGIEMEQTATGVYTWTGVINEGHFKFISQLGTWHSILPSKLANETLQSGVAADISNDFREDYKFAITERGTYSLTLDLGNKTLIATQISKEAPIYILGDAMSFVGWDNRKALKMEQPDTSKAIYTWTGTFYGNQFKFITELGTWKSIIPTQPRNENILSGYKHSVTDIWHGDYRFNVAGAGDYTVTLNMEDNTMTVVKKEGAAMPIYLLGDAIPAADGWNNNAGRKMEQTATGVYTWTGIIDKGYFKFISESGTWHSILPSKLANETLQSGVAAEISNDFRGDYKFAVTERGTYSLTLDLTNKTLIATQISKKAPVYILGTAISGVVWNNNKALEMGQPDASKAIYTWVGQLGSGHFKFITEPGTWESIIPTQSRNENVLSSYPHSVTNKWHGDYRFNVTVAGNYTVTLNMEDNTMTVVKDDTAMPIYLLGDAIPDAAGWDNNAGIKMEQTATGVYTWTGVINKGYFKFISQSGTWHSILPSKLANETLQSGVAADISNDFREDYKFAVTERGTYSLTLDLTNKTLVATQISKGGPVYILGDRCKKVYQKQL